VKDVLKEIEVNLEGFEIWRNNEATIKIIKNGGYIHPSIFINFDSWQEGQAYEHQEGVYQGLF